MSAGEKGNIPSLKESELLMHPELREAFPELLEYAKFIREAFQKEGVKLDESFNLSGADIIKRVKGVNINFPEVCHNASIAWDPNGNCGTGCTECVGPCVACTSWANTVGECGIACTECVRNV